MLDLVGEQDGAHAVLVPHRSERDDGGDLRRELALGELAGAEVARRAHVDQELDRHLALLREALHVGAPGAGGHVPVDRARGVAGDVFPHLVELHSAPPQEREVTADHRFLDSAVRPQLEPSGSSEDALHVFLGVHRVLPSRGQGIRTPSRIRPTTSSAVMPSASAS